ncbi:hypothetical protein [Opitutus sp. GAS368]|jgi:hypothetical protein|nr:hypothetical protein [Opitutus sp. GAS368]SDR67090.1 hypothetical protein SAMN05444173_0268 [Opitutus sp. GAS368]
MLDDPAEQPLPSVTASRPAFPPGTLIAVGVWACVFATFIVLGLRS